MSWGMTDPTEYADPLAPSRGCLIGILCAMPFWAVIVAIVVRLLTR